MASSGFFEKYMTGQGLDIGYAGYTDGCLPILSTATGIDLNYPGYDGIHLTFPDESQDYVYSSHCLEHIFDWNLAIIEWQRVLKVDGHMVIVVPHQYLYERRSYPPSQWNEGHIRFYTPSKLMHEIECSLLPNSYRLRLLEDGDWNYNYSIPKDKHPDGQYELICVLQKIKKPAWRVI